MPLDQKQGVPFSTPPMSSLEERMPDWQSAYVFLHLHRSGSMRGCARRLEMSMSTIRRHIDQLEEALGKPLLIRSFDGVRATPEGEELLAIVDQMENLAISMLRINSSSAVSLSGSVRIGVSEGLGAAWLTPHLSSLQRECDKLRIDFVCGLTSVDVSRMQADISVQLTRPEALDVKVVRLGYLHVMPYASEIYIEKFGCPSNIEELAQHRLVLQISEQTSTAEHLSRIFADVPFTGDIVMTANFGTAVATAIANSIGIGWMPTYVTPAGLGLIPIECGANLRYDVWLTFHRDVEKIPRVRHVIEWTRSIFNARRFPFFGENRVPPKELEVLGLSPPLNQSLRAIDLRDPGGP